jgi:2-(1,2-epoxy-1,2-dihydrophenyl)acetyl-CoA isomerase
VAIVEYAVEGRVARLHLNRPERLNAVVPALTEALLTGLEAAAADGARAIVLAGRGRAFCAGHDLKEPEPVEDEAAARARLQRLQDVTRWIRGFPGLVVAAVHGYALGAGCEFALGCDLVVAGEDARFGFPEVGVGLSVTGGISALLPVAVGPFRAKELLALGEPLSAARAAELGLVNRVVPEGEHEAAALELARACASRPPIALELAKRVIDEGMSRPLDEMLDREVDNALVTWSSGEAADGRDRFAKRPS